MEIEIRKDDILERKADGRGRITIGSGYADKTVEVVVLDATEKE